MQDEVTTPNQEVLIQELIIIALDGFLSRQGPFKVISDFVTWG